eukprot:1161145-Pelagomonas_calceolata.AAC.8
MDSSLHGHPTRSPTWRKSKIHIAGLIIQVNHSHCNVEGDWHAPSKRTDKESWKLKSYMRKLVSFISFHASRVLALEVQDRKAFVTKWRNFHPHPAGGPPRGTFDFYPAPLPVQSIMQAAWCKNT